MSILGMEKSDFYYTAGIGGLNVTLLLIYLSTNAIKKNFTTNTNTEIGLWLALTVSVLSLDYIVITNSKYELASKYAITMIFNALLIVVALYLVHKSMQK
jgi:hypothetical protein